MNQLFPINAIEIYVLLDILIVPFMIFINESAKLMQGNFVEAEAKSESWSKSEQIMVHMHGISVLIIQLIDNLNGTSEHIVIVLTILTSSHSN